MLPHTNFTAFISMQDCQLSARPSHSENSEGRDLKAQEGVHFDLFQRAPWGVKNRHHVGSSLVSATESALIAGAAKTTTGNMAIHATSPDNSQCLKNPTRVGDGKLAMPAAIKLVSPA
jgi:hypothetical protein